MIITRPSGDAPKHARKSSLTRRGSHPSLSPRPPGAAPKSASKQTPRRPASADRRGDRKLSFVDCTLNQVRDAIVSADPEWRFNVGFWETLLTGEHVSKSKPLLNRTLTFWTEVFNKWQDHERSPERKIPSGILSGSELQPILVLSKGNFRGVIELFDPEGGRRLDLEGYSDSTMGAVRIPMLLLCAAGVLSTRLISSAHKLRFLVSLVDQGDAGALDKDAFAIFIRTFCQGLSIMFGIPSSVMLKDADAHRAAQQLFQRIGDVAKTKELKLGPDGALTVETIHAWCCGSLADEDPIALPYHLALERFCPTRHGDFSDEFEETLFEFSLSHVKPTVIPKGTKTPAGCKVLSRGEVVLARDLLRHAVDTGIIRLGDREFNGFMKSRGAKIVPSVRDWYLDALEKLSEEHRRVGNEFAAQSIDASIDVFKFIRKLSPKTLPKHMRMYDVWLAEYDKAKKDQETLLHLATAVDEFKTNQAKPLLSEDEQVLIKEQFRLMDSDRDGLVTVEDIMDDWACSEEQASPALKYFDVCSDGYLDEHEFMRMMCPDEYRVPEMTGLAREMFGKLLVSFAAEQQGAVDVVQSKFESKSHPAEGAKGVVPASALPLVPEEQLQAWNDVFDGLDRDDDNTVQVKDLECSGLLATAVCYSIAGTIDPSNPTGFTRDSFLAAMCKAHGYRRQYTTSSKES